MELFLLTIVFLSVYVFVRPTEVEAAFEDFNLGAFESEPIYTWYNDIIATSEEPQMLAIGRHSTEGEVYAALPDRSALNRNIEVSWQGRKLKMPILDVGPWNISDDYWNTGERPKAERNRLDFFSDGFESTNGAGLDISEDGWAALGHPQPTKAKELVSWRFCNE